MKEILQPVFWWYIENVLLYIMLIEIKLHKKPILKLRAVEYAISFFRFLIYVYFNEAFIKKFMK